MYGLEKPFFVHPSAICDSPNIGKGTRIWAFSHVLKEARIGDRCNLGEHVFVENGVVIGDGCTIKNGVALWDQITLEEDVFVGPYVVFTNDLRPRAFLKRGNLFYLPTIIKRGATLGANSTIVCGVTVGEYAMVGAGTVVTKDVPPHTLVVGNPMRALGKICFCGEKLSARGACPECNLPLEKNSPDFAAKRVQELKKNLAA